MGFLQDDQEEHLSSNKEELTMVCSCVSLKHMKILLPILLSFFLAACNTTTQFSRKDPQRGLVVQHQYTASAGAHANAPVLLRIIKESKTLELWKQNKDSSWSHVKTYDICTYSGELGPKRRQGDRQAPEGFYSITRSSLNPMSSEHLSINTGFPNARDRSHGYTGSALMIHGGCSSRGCYAITDPAMEGLYAAVRDALKAGQPSIQIQIYPFAMSDFRMSREKNNPNYVFWQELKAGWDKFEKTKQPLTVDVRRGQYIIN